MDLGLQDARVVVTGASKGIGLAVTEALLAEGALVVAGARSLSPALAALVEGGRVRHVAVDLSGPAGPQHLVDAALADGPVDVLVNNVGAVTPRLNGFLSVTDDQWEATLNLTLLAAIRATRAVLPGMLAAGRGAIVTISSVNSVLADPTVIDYCAAKAAVANFSKSLSKEVGPRGIRVNAISPGPVATDLWLGEHGVAATVADHAGGNSEAVAKSAAAGASTGRFTQPHEVAELVVLLAGTRAANVTGSDFVIDGGLLQTVR
jgi:NAD(P)-dependent dehydrogenase (short-subunit alcohol dehydrogenase family)